MIACCLHVFVVVLGLSHQGLYQYPSLHSKNRMAWLIIRSLLVFLYLLLITDINVMITK